MHCRRLIVFDKFHILRDRSDALDGVRRRRYKRVTGDERTSIKGQRYVLLSCRENLSDGGRQNLERLLQANARLNIAYLLREQFEQLWSYTDPADARSFFDNWQQQLQGQDLAPYEKFARMIERHWEGIASYCKPENKVALGFVEASTTKSASSSAAPSASATRSTSPLKSGHSDCPNSDYSAFASTKKRESHLKDIWKAEIDPKRGKKRKKLRARDMSSHRLPRPY